MFFHIYIETENRGLVNIFPCVHTYLLFRVWTQVNKKTGTEIQTGGKKERGTAEE
jgi:hypothetical protein